jgi:acetolactate synthase regulatory subunit
MVQSRSVGADERIIEPMIALARCSKLQRIIVAGSRSVELVLELHRSGYVRAAATANCGHAAGQYDVALVDWRQRTFKALERTLDWLVEFLGPAAVLVVWIDPQKPTVRQELQRALERRGFVVEAVTAGEDGSAVSARRYLVNPLAKAA